MRVTLIINSGPAAGKTFEFTQTDTLLFGRATDAHVQIVGDKMVSRNHFLLLMTEDECRVRDLDSANGTYVSRGGKYLRYGGKSLLPNGAVAAPGGAADAVLADGDIINVGETKLTVSIQPPDDRTLLQPTAPDDAERTFLQQSPPTALKSEPSCGSTLIETPMTVPTPAVPAGKRFPNAPDFSGYEILDKLGEGGMGVVVKARQLSSGRIVAIKTMHSPKGGNAMRMVDAFEREIRIHQTLKHPNIVEQLDVVRAGPILGVVLEFVDGMDLKKYVNTMGGQVPFADAMPLIQGILSGLAHAHAAGIVHRDLKPENIFLTMEGWNWKAKVADFGLAKSYEASGKSLFEIAGTPPFWPREHITSYQSLYPASDVFSIAAVFYWMLTGVHAREGMSEMLAKFAAAGRNPGFGDYTQVVTAGKIVPISQRLPSLPPAFAKILDRALKEEELPRDIQNDKNALRMKLAEMRFSNAGAFKDALVMAARNGASLDIGA